MDESEEINDESDHEVDSPSGYYTRAKRRKLSEKYSDKEQCSTSQLLYRSTELGKRKNPIMFVPTEVLQNIFKRISYHELSTKIRLVNRRFKTVAEDMLNIGFKCLEKKIQNLIRMTDISLGYTRDDMEIKCISKLLCMLEILNLQYAIIVATIWRYVYNDYYRTPRFCMYAGLIIDTHESFFYKFSHCPCQLYAAPVLRDYSLPQEVMKIIQMTKSFCVHFDKTNEEPLTNSCVLSGCKILDLLDCSKFCERIVHFERKTGDNFFAKYSYFFKNSWFVAMPIPPTKDMEWSQKQRMMHMRLRRIVLAHNDMYLQQDQYQREIALRYDHRTSIKKPGNNVYTGYGDIEDRFFYYGVMNDGAFIQKFHPDEGNEEQDDEDDINDNPVQNRGDVELVRVNSEEDVFYSLPYLGFRVDVTVCCSPIYAPLKFMKTLSHDDRRKVSRKHSVKDVTHIHMDFECFGAHYARLPTRYQYVFRPRKKPN
ncbi:uncharacterized protein LOC115884348 [Sitophilus oryzae]|uniref:Uncharacterized protein LOC115884348 n=1 Tax=Sitophilus oryzae TaxID=7048 RepID=A0A6J2Y6B5_SITOR|nr:uncharacterized protein LOC115884348 [Sitophilus oryzae]